MLIHHFFMYNKTYLAIDIQDVLKLMINILKTNSLYLTFKTDKSNMKMSRLCYDSKVMIVFK